MKKYVFLGNSSKPKKEEYESTEIKKISNVSRPCILAAHELGYEIYLGTNRKYPERLSTDMEFPVNMYDAHTYRSITNFKDNLTAYNNLNKLLRTGDFEVIHCNTPVGGLIGRICGRKHGIEKIIYTVHGFHFYKGAPLINSTIFKLAEKVMARWTDAIITMNKEDYETAKKLKLKKNGKVYFVHGVGINVDEYTNIIVDKVKKRNELGLKKDDIILISMGDLVKRKNYKIAIEAISKANNSKIHYLICGKGPEMKKLEKLAENLGVRKQIHFLGYRTDIKELLAVSDIFLFTTLQEGLPRSMMEAMATGLPCIASEIRGNIDLINNGEGGYLCKANDSKKFADAINNLANNSDLRDKMKLINLKKIENYDIHIVEKEIIDIYKDILKIKEKVHI